VVILYLIYIIAFDFLERSPLIAVLGTFTLVASIWIHIEAIRLLTERFRKGEAGKAQSQVNPDLKWWIVILVLFASMSPNIIPVLSATQVPHDVITYLPHIWVWITTIWLYRKLPSLKEFGP
jgi:hypothetical protein